MSDNTYNGWTNYETWQAGLWLNESDFVGHCQECEFTEITPEMVEDELHLIAGAEDLKGLASDIFNSWISCVNMHELVDHFNKDLEAY
jgi:hypothetical protein